MQHLIIIAIAILATGCASTSYRETKAGKFSGALDVRWIKNDYFLFVPNEQEPLTFKRSNGETITPGVMYTDGGSIPRFLWGVKGYSPWGYAPAYIIHDWLFEAQHCGHQPDDKYVFEDSVAMMAESLKAVMEEDHSVRNYFVFDSVISAIASPIAKRLWEKGGCHTPSREVQPFLVSPDQGELIMTIRYQ